MGNASDIILLVSRISKDHDFLMGSLYAIFGEQQEFFPCLCTCRSATMGCLRKPRLLVSQACCRWRGTGSCSSWPTGRSPPWSRRSFSWSTWPLVTWAWPWPFSRSPSPQPSLTCEGASTFLLLLCSSIMSLGRGVAFNAFPQDVQGQNK